MPRLVCQSFWRYSATGSLSPPVLYEYVRLAVSVPVGSYCLSSCLASAGLCWASGSWLSPRSRVTPLVFRRRVAAVQSRSWHTVLARPVLSTARSKALRRPTAAADSPTNGPPVFGYPMAKLSHVVRPLGWVSRSLAYAVLLMLSMVG